MTFDEWLRTQQYAEGTIGTQSARMTRLRATYPDIDAQYDSDSLGALMKTFSYHPAGRRGRVWRRTWVLAARPAARPAAWPPHQLPPDLRALQATLLEKIGSLTPPKSPVRIGDMDSQEKWPLSALS